MAVNWFRCKKCGIEIRSKGESPIHCDEVMEKLLKAPLVTMKEPQDKVRGKSKLKNQEKILKERARNHSRDIDMPELIESNPMIEAVKNGWVREDGRVRKKIDDK